MITRAIITAAVLAAFPQALSGQSSADVNASVAVEATVHAGLPEEPVQHTIQEERARGAGDAEVARAAFATHTRLHAAREALRRPERPEPTSAEIVAGADALLAGAHTSDLERVRDSAEPGRSVAASLSVLADLSARGAEPAALAGEISAGLAAGASDQAIAELAGQLAASGTAPGAGSAAATVGGAAGADLLGPAVGIGTSVIGGVRLGL